MSADAVGEATGLPLPRQRRHVLSRVRVSGLRRLLGPTLVVVIWFLGSAFGLIPERALASPATVVTTATDLATSGELHPHMLVSLRRVLLGLAVGVAVGTALAVLTALSRWAEDLLDGPLQILRALPILALLPLAILWLGIGEQVKVVLIALGTLFPIYINTHAAIRSVDPRFEELATVVGLRRSELVRKVVLPGALPGFFTGLRFSVQIAWLVLVVAEQVNAREGVGFLMMQAREFYRTDIIVVGLVIYGALGLLSDHAVRTAQRRLLPWRRTFGEGAA